MRITAILFVSVLLILDQFCVTNASPTVAEKKVRSCMRRRGSTRRPLIIDTDTDVDDLWAIHYLLNEPTIDVLAITTVGNAFSGPFYSASNVLRFLDLLGCNQRVPVAYGLNSPLLSTGWKVSDAILGPINTYLTASNCLNESANIFIQPSPFDAVELIKLTLKYASEPVDILVMGTMTNIAAAISEDRSIIPKIGTLYFSGGQFKSTRDYPSLIPDLNAMTYPYTGKTSSSSSNVFLDVLAVQRVGQSKIKNFVAMPSLTQKQLQTNLTQLTEKLTQLGITLNPFFRKLNYYFARCTNQADTEINWWDNSAAQFMIQMQSKNQTGFCEEIKTVKSLYVLAADSHQLFGQGMTDVDLQDPTLTNLPTYKVCTKANSDVFLTEYLTKIHSNKLTSCKKAFSERHDTKLQRCLQRFGLDK